jgi:hypothetical protein
MESGERFPGEKANFPESERNWFNFFVPEGAK